jgi:hypothetical protein
MPDAPAIGETPKGAGANVNGAVVYVPDYYGRHVQSAPG